MAVADARKDPFRGYTLYSAGSMAGDAIFQVVSHFVSGVLAGSIDKDLSAPARQWA